MNKVADILASDKQLRRIATEAKTAELERLPSGFAKLEKGLVMSGMLLNLSLTAVRVYLVLLTKCYEKITGSMAKAGKKPRECDVSYAYLARLVPGRSPGKGACRGALKKGVGELLAAGLVTVIRRGTGPSHPTRYRLRTFREWTVWAAENMRVVPGPPVPNGRDTRERGQPRQRPRPAAKEPPLTAGQLEQQRQAFLRAARCHAESQAAAGGAQ